MINKLYSKFDGTAALARGLGKPLSTVSSWKQRGRIPDKYHEAFLTLAKERGIPLTREDFYSQ